MQMTQAEKHAKPEKVSDPNSVNEIIKKSKIERVLPKETVSEMEEEDASGSGMDEMDEGEDEESDDTYDDTQEYVTE
jgi:hypothetical protein